MPKNITLAVAEVIKIVRPLYRCGDVHIGVCTSLPKLAFNLDFSVHKI